MLPLVKDASEAARAEAEPQPAPGTTNADKPKTPAQNLGHFWRIADRYYGDTALIASMQAAGHKAEHTGFGSFSIALPGGRLHFNRAQDERLFEEQVGRVHTLDPQGDVDLPKVLADLEAAGLAASGGEWETMPTSYPPPKEPILAGVPAPPEPAFAAPAEPVTSDDEPAEDLPAPTVPAEEGGLEFSIDPKELQGALNLIKRVSDPRDSALSQVQIECRGHVIFRVGAPAQFFELRLQSTRCAAMGAATVEVKPLLDAPRTLGKQRLVIRKVAHEPHLRLSAGGRQVELATSGYTPIGLESDPTHVVSLPGDVLADMLHRTTFAVSRSKSREHLMVLHLESDGTALRLVSTDGHRMAVASTAATGTRALDGLQISVAAAERIETLVDQHLALARPRGRSAAREAPPVHLLVTAGSDTRAKMLIVRSELFTFAAAHVPVQFPRFQAVVPAIDKLGGLCVVQARELAEALASVARAKDNAVLEFGDALQVTNKAGEGEPVLRFAIRDVFVSGPPHRALVNPELLRPAIEAAIQNDRPYVGLAYEGQGALSPLVVTRWLADERPRDRREALAKLHAEVRDLNIAVIMPMRE